MTRAQLRAEERRWRRGDGLAIVAALALGAAFAWIILAIQGINDDLYATRNDLQSERAYNRALADQVEGLGGTPVPGAEGSPGASVTGPPGKQGERGDPGASGRPGPTVTPSPGASGASGVPGADSTVPGPSGAPGADSTVPGPSGAPGVDGRDGADGADGTDGEDGRPPAGWMWTDRFGDTYSCEPVEGFDPDVPEYTCARSEPDPEPGSAPQAAALDPRRTLYV